jgi:hypothetical protein
MFTWTTAARNGTDRNENAIAYTMITANNWIALYDDGTEFSYSSTLTWSTLTPEIRDRGMVVAYLKTDTSSEWYALPYSYSGDTHSDAFNYSFNTGLVNITYDGYDDAGSPGTAALNGELTVRLVAVPSDVRRANPDLNWSDYSQVRAKFKLPE